MKSYSIQYNIGSAKYVVNYHDGVKTHQDGSLFYDIQTFSNKKALATFENKLLANGYVHA